MGVISMVESDACTVTAKNTCNQPRQIVKVTPHCGIKGPEGIIIYLSPIISKNKVELVRGIFF
jgi:hypothetical protein